MLLNTLLDGQVPALVVLLFGLCLAVSAVGFYRTVYFISIGYGFSIAAVSILAMALARRWADPVTWTRALLG